MYYDRKDDTYKKECKRIYDNLKNDLGNVEHNVSLCEDYHLALHHINHMEDQITNLEEKVKKYEKIFSDFRNAMYNQI